MTNLIRNFSIANIHFNITCRISHIPLKIRKLISIQSKTTNHVQLFNDTGLNIISNIG